jgi:hypothetical protein
MVKEENTNLQVDHTFVTYFVTVWIAHCLKQTVCQLCTFEIAVNDHRLYIYTQT